MMVLILASLTTLALVAIAAAYFALRHLSAAHYLYRLAGTRLAKVTSELERVQHILRKRLSVRFGPVRFRRRGEQTMFLKGPANRLWDIPLEFFDDEGGPAAVDGTPTFSTDNTTVGSVLEVVPLEVDADHPVRNRFIVVFEALTPGFVRLNGLADAKLGEGFERLEFAETLEVLHPKASQAKMGASGYSFRPRSTPEQVPPAPTNDPAPAASTPAEPPATPQEPATPAAPAPVATEPAAAPAEPEPAQA